MPELPEVETVRRQLHDHVVGTEIVDGDSHPSHKFSAALEAIGSEVTALSRRGKYLLFRLDDDRELVGHLGMTGSFSLQPASTSDPSCADHDPYVRAVLRLDAKELTDLVFRDVRRFGRLRVVKRGSYSEIPTLHHMGPEPMSKEFTGATLHKALLTSSRPVKTQLLSQRPVAGVGNIYADEALFIARINPKASRIGRARCDRLADAIDLVLRQGIENGGTTIRDYVNADGESGTNQAALAVYGRGGEPCVECGRTLRSIVLDARTTTYCLHCQRQ